MDLSIVSSVAVAILFAPATFPRIRELADEKARAERARIRFESRNERMEQEQLSREQELAQQKDTALKAGPAAIEEIMRRQKAKDKKDADET